MNYFSLPIMVSVLKFLKQTTTPKTKNNFATVFFIVLSFWHFSAQAQYYSYKNKKFEWPAATPTKIEVESKFADDDAVILDEETELAIIRMAQNMYNNNKVDKHVRVKFLTRKGIDKFSTFTLPESFDLSRDYGDLEIWKRDSVHRPKANFDAINYFAARIIKPDGSIVKPVIADKSTSELFYWQNNERRFFDYQFKIANLEVNDELEIYYSITDIFNKSRVFMNGTISKQNMTFVFKNNLINTYIVQCFNGLKPIDTIFDSDTRKIIWKLKDLNGCMDEQGSRPYTELPYFTYYLHLRDFGIMDAKRNHVEVALPYTWSFILQAYANFDFPHDTLYDHDNFVVRKFFNQYVGKDTNAVNKFLPIHNLIVDTFKYKFDEEYMRKGDDVRMERMGEFIESKTLREMSRYRLYEKFIYLLNTNYYVAYPQDKRSDEIQFDSFSRFYRDNTFFCILDNNNPNYFFPKNNRFGFYRNEFPFYYEDANVILIPQRTPKEESYKPQPKIGFLDSKMPYSSVRENTRLTNVMADVSLDSLKINFTAHIKLSGQFSTLQRGYYQFAYYDSTVSMQYFKGVYDNIKGVSKPKTKLTESEIDFPFKANFESNYSTSLIVEKQSNNQYKINLAQWFKHIYISEFTSKKRSTAFYPDFVFFDEYKYYLKFDKNISVVDTAVVDFEVQTSLGIYKISCKQIQPNIILLQSTFAVNANKVKADEVSGVQVIYNYIEELNKKQLTIQAE